MTTPTIQDNESKAPGLSRDEARVEKTRAWTGFYVVFAGDIVIVAASIFAVWALKSSDTSSTAIVSVLTAAFTAVGTMTTAYFGIRAATNTAQSSLTNPPTAGPSTAGPSTAGPSTAGPSTAGPSTAGPSITGP